MELNEIKVRLKGHSDPKAGVFFDAIFTDPEAKVLLPKDLYNIFISLLGIE